MSKNLSTLELKRLIQFALKTTVVYSGNLTIKKEVNTIGESPLRKHSRKDEK